MKHDEITLRAVKRLMAIADCSVAEGCLQSQAIVQEAITEALSHAAGEKGTYADTTGRYAQPPAAAIALGEDVRVLNELRPMLMFLYGEGQLDGCWFGEPHPSRSGNYWWRSKLRDLESAIASRIAERASPVELDREIDAYISNYVFEADEGPHQLSALETMILCDALHGWEAAKAIELNPSPVAAQEALTEEELDAADDERMLPILKDRLAQGKFVDVELIPTAELDAIRKDRERLDWLEANPRDATIRIGTDTKACVLYGVSCDPKWSIREAIDAARTPAEPT